MKFLIVLLSTVFILCVAGASSSAFAQADQKQLTVMSYNVENLFDAAHDKGKNDYTFTPTGTLGKKSYCDKQYGWRRIECFVDWNQDRYDQKLAQISESILALEDGLPDFLALQEVENRAVVEDLARTLGYEAVRKKPSRSMDNISMTESPDQRGIDVALIYQPSESIEQIGSAKEHSIDLSQIHYKPSRNILEVQFRVFGSYKVYFFVVHWPSQGGGKKSNKARILVANKLQKLVNKVKLQDPKNHIIVLGDFNVLESDRPHAIYDVLYGRNGETKLYDAFEGYLKNVSIPKKKKYMMPLGTTFYPNNMSWSRFDRILVSDNLEAGYIQKCQRGLAVLTESYSVHTPEFLLDDYTYEDPRNTPGALTSFHMGSTVRNVPYRFRVVPEDGEKIGYSDHFGIYLKLWESQFEPRGSECTRGREFGYRD